MRRDFQDRDDLIAYVREQFPEAEQRSPQISPRRGGWKAAQAQLAMWDLAAYGATRNFLKGAVSQLSPYLRHGVLTLAEVRDFILERVDADKLIQQLAWRDYWQRLYVKLSDGIWEDQEPYKTGYAAQDYRSTLPNDIQRGETGLVCIDHFSEQLQSDGYLHNHARLWLAAYVVHWRRVRWQVGAHWFLQHLLDGDPASNNLSWQWVASTFSVKPYYFNRENLERFTNRVYCSRCPLRGQCVFEGSYERLAEQLFPNSTAL